MKLVLLGIIVVVALCCANPLEKAADEAASIGDVLTDQVQGDVSDVARQKRGGVYWGYHGGLHSGYNVGEQIRLLKNQLRNLRLQKVKFYCQFYF